MKANLNKPMGYTLEQAEILIRTTDNYNQLEASKLLFELLQPFMSTLDGWDKSGGMYEKRIALDEEIEVILHVMTNINKDMIGNNDFNYRFYRLNVMPTGGDMDVFQQVGTYFTSGNDLKENLERAVESSVLSLKMSLQHDNRETIDRRIKQYGLLRAAAWHLGNIAFNPVKAQKDLLNYE